MQPILFATGNSEKFAIAQDICSAQGIALKQFVAASDEIQSENPENIVRDKALKQYALAGNVPVIVSDDSWSMPGLRGFPGPYMKDMDRWFEPQQFIDLLRHVAVKRIELHRYLAYYDGAHMHVFSAIIPGIITDKPRGTYGRPAQKVIALDHDNGLTIAEVYDKGTQQAAARFSGIDNAWPQFITWYKEQLA